MSTQSTDLVGIRMLNTSLPVYFGRDLSGVYANLLHDGTRDQSLGDVISFDSSASSEDEFIFYTIIVDDGNIYNNL